MELTKKGAESRERIVSAAIGLFARKGFAGTGMRELAERAETNPAMINYFFGSKKGLLKEILDHFFTGYLGLLTSRLGGAEEPTVKIRRFICDAVDYIAANRDAMIIVLTELPHDDPDITEYKASWAAKAMGVIQKEICTPLRKEQGVVISPAVLGPLLIGMMSSRFLFAPVMEELNPPGLREEFLEHYPDLVATIFLDGLQGLRPTNPGEKT